MNSSFSPSALSQIPLEGESETRLQSDYDDGEDTSCSSQEFESMRMREEKALSDSEVKVSADLMITKQERDDLARKNDYQVRGICRIVLFYVIIKINTCGVLVGR